MSEWTAVWSESHPQEVQVRHWGATDGAVTYQVGLLERRIGYPPPMGLSKTPYSRYPGSEWERGAEGWSVPVFPKVPAQRA